MGAIRWVRELVTLNVMTGPAAFFWGSSGVLGSGRGVRGLFSCLGP